ncbi:MAG: alkaline shock response membrane anchor protein AmaP [Kiritimatiellae bacterium]|nr:alkaline shock response membrane anchor protein AmaP [Kiritimatiellia bacterium]
MKTFHFLIGLILGVAILAGVFFVVSTAFQGDAAWAARLEMAKSQKMYAVFGGLALVLLVLLFALTSFRLPEKSQYIAYDIEGSSVSISLRAVQDFVARLSGEFAAVQELKPVIRVHNGSADVQLDVKIRAGAQIPELCRMLQDRARATLREKVGLSDVREVRVRVQEIVGAASSEALAGEKSDTFMA